MSKNVLWVTNVLLPEASILLKKNPTPYGGWLDLSSQKLSNNINIRLTIASPYNDKQIKIIETEKIRYIYFPRFKDRKIIKSSKIVEKIFSVSKPQIVHIFGTEMIHSYIFYRFAKNNNIKTIINIQGLVSQISKQVYFMLPLREIIIPTLRTILNNDSLRRQKNRFNRIGSKELIMLKYSDFVVGRTTWDYSIFKQQKPEGDYFKWNETLRDVFYNQRWDYHNKEKNTIFLSQGNYSIKGLHQVIKALIILKSEYPDVKLKISGKNILSDKIFGIKAYDQYARYIFKLIKKNKLEKNIQFLGELNKEDMLLEYKKANVFVISSAIENSPNSLGEANMLGVPTISSYVGGIPDFITHLVDGFLYNPNDENMLAFYIDKIFKSTEDEILYYTNNARMRANSRYNIDNNSEELLNLYSEIFK